jgi:hypothetical protein
MPPVAYHRPSLQKEAGRGDAFHIRDSAVIMIRLASIPRQHDSRRLSFDVGDIQSAKDRVDDKQRGPAPLDWCQVADRGSMAVCQGSYPTTTASTSTEFHPIGNQGSLLPTGHRRLTAAVIGDHHAGLRGKSFGMIISTGRAQLLLRRVVVLVLRHHRTTPDILPTTDTPATCSPLPGNGCPRYPGIPCAARRPGR